MLLCFLKCSINGVGLERGPLVLEEEAVKGMRGHTQTVINPGVM